MDETILNCMEASVEDLKVRRGRARVPEFKDTMGQRAKPERERARTGKYNKGFDEHDEWKKFKERAEAMLKGHLEGQVGEERVEAELEENIAVWKAGSDIIPDTMKVKADAKS